MAVLVEHPAEPDEAAFASDLAFATDQMAVAHASGDKGADSSVGVGSTSGQADGLSDRTLAVAETEVERDQIASSGSTNLDLGRCSGQG